MCVRACIRDVAVVLSSECFVSDNAKLLLFCFPLFISTRARIDKCYIYKYIIYISINIYINACDDKRRVYILYISIPSRKLCSIPSLR